LDQLKIHDIGVNFGKPERGRGPVPGNGHGVAGEDQEGFGEYDLE
jgi:hypothetical protein